MSLFPPPLAGALGAGGLVPFLATSAPVQLVLPFDALLKPLRSAIGRPSLNATELQVTYGCMILSLPRRAALGLGPVINSGAARRHGVPAGLGRDAGA